MRPTLLQYANITGIQILFDDFITATFSGSSTDIQLWYNEFIKFPLQQYSHVDLFVVNSNTVSDLSNVVAAFSKAKIAAKGTLFTYGFDGDVSFG